MTPKPFIDRDELANIMLAAKVERTKFLARKTGEISGPVRWSGMAVLLLASTFAFLSTFATPPSANPHGVNANSCEPHHTAQCSNVSSSARMRARAE